MSDSPLSPPGQRLGALLAEARRNKGLELSDVAEVTHVRKEYLRALEDGRHQDLPEDVYARNFVKLYAQAVGFDERQALQLFSRERRTGVVAAELKPQPELEVDLGAAPREEPRRLGALWQDTGLSWLVPSLLIVGVLVGVAIWAFNSLLFPASPVSPAQPEVVAPQPLTPPRVENLVLLSVTSEPPGAEVSLDGFVFANPTPIVNAPVTPGRDRLLRVALEGFETYEAPIDVTFDRNLSVALTPLEGAVGVPAAANIISLVVEATSWLEVYSGTSRGGGAKLLFRNVQPGETFTFPLPVFLHAGNAGGIVASIGGHGIGRLGASGEVLSRAFTTP
jgi:transcriptional regulator with XRE-family HTH domain